MADKNFIVRSSKTGEELTIKGKDLEDALNKEYLNPSIWQPVEVQELDSDPENG